jgi:hypothetical protein
MRLAPAVPPSPLFPWPLMLGLVLAALLAGPAAVAQAQTRPAFGD